MIGGSLLFLTMIAIAYQVIDGASVAFDKYGFAFLGNRLWIPAVGQFGAFPFIYGTLVTSVLCIILATFLGVAIGLFLSLMAPRRVSAIVGPLVEMLAAIPSVVLGLIGIALIAPFIVAHVEPILHDVLGFLPIFGTPGTVGNSLFTASLVLTIMVVPIVAALSRDLFLTVPLELRDGAEALGATRWEMIRGVVLPTTSSGVIAACVLGFGRAIGEAIAVSQVVGDAPLTPHNLFLPGDTLASRLALQFASPVSALHESVAVLPRGDPVRVRADHQPGRSLDRLRLRVAPSERDPGPRSRADRDAATCAAGQAVSRVVVSLTVAAAALAVAVLLILVYYVIKQGIQAISLRFYTSDLPSYTGSAAASAPPWSARSSWSLIATLIALPVGLLTALYLTQFAGPRADRVLRLILDLMAGLPTIIIGVFVAGLITNRFGQSALAGASPSRSSRCR